MNKISFFSTNATRCIYCFCYALMCRMWLHAERINDQYIYPFQAIIRSRRHCQHIGNIPQTSINAIPQNRKLSMHYLQRQHLRLMDVKRSPGFHLLQENTRNTWINLINKAIRHTGTQMASSIGISINRNLTKTTKRAQIVQPPHMVIMFMSDQHPVYRFKKTGPQHLFPKIRTAIYQYIRIIGTYQGRRTQTIVAFISRCTHRAFTPHFWHAGRRPAS